MDFRTKSTIRQATLNKTFWVPNLSLSKHFVARGYTWSYVLGRPVGRTLSNFCHLTKALTYRCSADSPLPSARRSTFCRLTIGICGSRLLTYFSSRRAELMFVHDPEKHSSLHFADSL